MSECISPVCDKSARARGMCWGHYERWLRGGDAKLSTPLGRLPRPGPRPCPRCGKPWGYGKGKYRCPGCGVSRYEADPRFHRKVWAENQCLQAIATAHFSEYRQLYQALGNQNKARVALRKRHVEEYDALYAAAKVSDPAPLVRVPPPSAKGPGTVTLTILSGSYR